MSRQRKLQRHPGRRQLLHELSRRFSAHELPIYASAIAFRALVAVLPLVFDGINASAEKVLTSGTAGLITFATALVIWDLTIGITAIMRALNHVHDVEEQRPFLRRMGVAAALAIGVGVCIVGAMLLLVVAPRAAGAFHVVFGILRWLLAPLLLGLAVGLLVRFAPAQKPESRDRKSTRL